jgi:hypothetical protein
VIVVGAGEHQARFEARDARGQCLRLALDLLNHPFITLGERHIEQFARIGDPLAERAPFANLLAQAGQLPHRPLRGTGVVPEVGRAAQLLELGDLCLFSG